MRNESERQKVRNYIVLWVRMFFGAHLLYSSLRYFVLFEPQPVVPGVGGEFVQVLTAMGLFPFVKAMEGVVGACLIANRFVPLLLLAEMPISVNIFWLNTFVVGTPRQLFTGPQELFLNLFLRFIPRVSKKRGANNLIILSDLSQV